MAILFQTPSPPLLHFKFKLLLSFRTNSTRAFIFLLLILNICLLPILSSGYAYGECIEGNCENGHGKFTLPDGSTYVGEFKNGTIYGHGKLTFPNGLTFEGEFKNGKVDGQAKQINPDGSIYIGEFKKNLAHGYGVLTFVDGTKIVGEFKDGRFTGKGKVYNPDGTLFIN